jgi:sugar phosphate isomerase/epimerase
MTEESGVDRRRFLRGAAAGALTLPTVGGLLAGPTLARGDDDRGWGHGGGSIPRENISIQLYTLSAMPLEQRLKVVADAGYRSVEHAGFGALTAAQFRDLLRKYGLRATSGHQTLPNPFDETAWRKMVADAVTIGQRYIVTAASPNTYDPATGIDGITSFRTAAEWKAYSAVLNRAGQIARQSGLRFGYHSHFWEFHGLDDDTPLTGYDIMLAETDPRLVHFELDLYWAWYAHRDPVQMVTTYGDRIRQFHVKDMRYLPGHKPTWADPAAGVIEFARIFAAAGEPRDHEYIVERDDAGTAAATTAAAGYNLLSRIRF